MPPRCIPSNSWSVPGTKCWPRLTLQYSLGHNLSGCNYKHQGRENIASNPLKIIAISITCGNFQ
jgi:hypothetical protein